MQIFRRLIGSKYGGIFAMAFIGLIAVAFVAGDMGRGGGLNLTGPSSGEVATIGKENLTVNEVQTRVQRVYDRIRQEQPELTMNRFLDEGGLKQVLDELIASKAITAYGEQQGLRISKALVDAEIARIPAFADATGNFSESQFRSMLAQQRISESELRNDISSQLMRQQLVAAAGAGARTPDGMVQPFAKMLLEERSGGLIATPSMQFAPKSAPTEDQLKTYYAAHKSQFTLPEQRSLSYVVIDKSRFMDSAAPTDAEIASAFKAKSAQYGARTTRDFEQLILPTETAAKAVAAKVKAGSTLSAAATGSGLAVSKLTGLDQAKLGAQSNDAIAAAAFAAAQGDLVGPIKGPLGWTLLRVEQVKTTAAKSLAEARQDIVAELRDAKAMEQFSDFVNKIDGDIGDGATLAEIAKARGLTVAETPLITGEGHEIRDPKYQPDDTVKPLLKPGFAMTAGDDPQIVPLKPNESAAILAVGNVVPTGQPPLAEVRQAALVGYALAEGKAKAKSAADKLAAAFNKGKSATEALAEAGLTGAAQQSISARRADINQAGQTIAPPLIALFSMKQGSARVLPLDNDRGFIVVHLDAIKQGDPASVPDLIPSTRAGLANVLGKEYADQLVNAAAQAVGVTRNEVAIASVEAALRKAGGGAE